MSSLNLNPMSATSSRLSPGSCMLGASLWLGRPAAAQAPRTAFRWLCRRRSRLFLPGFFSSLPRKNALTQCLGYIILENGIYIIGVASVVEIPVLVELGILLDASVAVLVMGVAIYHINREFDHIDTDRLDTLKG